MATSSNPLQATSEYKRRLSLREDAVDASAAARKNKDPEKASILQFFAKNCIYAAVGVITCFPLRLFVWLPFLGIFGLALAPISLYFLHLPFRVVPWWKQILWHYVMIFHMADIPVLPWLSLLQAISNW